jgi:hypothetical protein
VRKQKCAIKPDLLGVDLLNVDEIRNQADLPIERVSATLALIQSKSIARQVGAIHYVKVCEEQSDCDIPHAPPVLAGGTRAGDSTPP